ncbi:LOW QUALITY PROTEIN: uncharacterized protein LOC110009937 [Jatropha curcas]|uniref:LOW QUALITY PROTEIN: uncharacterized protein LOC110009937 n=1 Tax=Jatropha curcas TaxID=180498 RepID=UPI0018959093|nr:LOW QUALITY PROTEIN: uncharacterized protein LOC110009937 [Jatropha curcas]
MQSHVKEIILYWVRVPEEMPLNLSDTKLHLRYFSFGIESNISFRLGMSFSERITENALQSKTSKNGGTKLSDIITGTHS